MAAAITNAQVMAAVEEVKSNVKEIRTCFEQLEKDVCKVTLEVFGNGKEGLHDKVKTLKDDYDQRKEEAKAEKSANLSLRNSLIVTGKQIGRAHV